MLAITFLNITRKAKGAVKSGESILIQFPHGSTMLIDTGVPESGEMLRDRLCALGVTRIDCLLLTHFHIDHIGGAPCLLDSFPVGKVITWPESYFGDACDNDRVPQLFAALRRHALASHMVWEGDQWEMDGVRIDVLGPCKHFPTDWQTYEAGIASTLHLPYYHSKSHPSEPFINDSSISLKCTYGKGSFLTCGDLYYPGEARLARSREQDLSCTLAKVNHHGAYTSSTKAWLLATRPKAVCAVRDSLPPVPKPEAASFWKDNVDSRPEKDWPAMGCDYYHTFVNGEVRFLLEEDGSFAVQVERGGKNML